MENFEPQRKRKRKKSVGCLLMVLLLILAGAGTLAATIRPPASPSDNTGVSEPEDSSQADTATDATSGEDPEDGEALSSRWRDGVYTFLVAGSTDNSNSDTIMVVMLDTKNSSVGILSIPRDTYVSSASRWLKKINGALGNGGIEQLKSEVADLIGYKPEHHILVNPDGVGALVDAVGGVEFDVPIDMDYDDDVQDFHVHLTAGPQTLNGQQAVGLLRYRQDNAVNGHIRGYPRGDLDRIETQQAFLRAAAEQVLTPANLFRIKDLVDLYSENVETDLTAGNLLWLALKIYAIGSEGITGLTLPTYSPPVDTNPNYYLYPADDSDEVVRSVVWPFEE